MVLMISTYRARTSLYLPCAASQPSCRTGSIIDKDIQNTEYRVQSTRYLRGYSVIRSLEYDLEPHVSIITDDALFVLDRLHKANNAVGTQTTRS